MKTEMKTIAIHSHKGGVGKTTIALLLAKQAAASGAKVCVADFDFIGSGMTNLFALQEKPRHYLDYFFLEPNPYDFEIGQLLGSYTDRELGKRKLRVMCNLGDGGNRQAAADLERAARIRFHPQGAGAHHTLTSDMAGNIILDDDFVGRQLGSVATRWPTLLRQTSTRSDVALWRWRRGIDDAVERCLNLFDRHHGIPTRGPIPEAHLIERRFLNYSMGIVGTVLNLDTVLPIYQRIIEVDWLAHIELNKEKRYRDHITHPVRVTAIGWWLLHREDGALLEELAHRYERETEAYRAAKDIDLRPHGWPSIVEYAWLACGLLHDSAYPLEYHLRAAEDLHEGYGDWLKIFTPQTRRFSTRRGRGVLLRPLEGSWLTGRLEPMRSWVRSSTCTAWVRGSTPCKGW